MTRSNLGKVLDRHQAEATDELVKREPPKSIYDVIAWLSPHLKPPVWLDPYIRALEKAILEGGVDLCFHGPPQHSKTEVAKHAFIFAALVRPGKKHAYSAFSATRAEEIVSEIKELATLAGLNPRSHEGFLRLEGGTTIRASGAGTGQLTGYPLVRGSLHIIDDPIKDEVEAASPVIRERRWNWLIKVAESRRHPGSSSVLMMARWHQDDLTARAVNILGWPYIRLAAICDSDDDPIGRKRGEALAPFLHPAAVLLKKRELYGINAFESLWQGNPRAEGDALFEPPTFYDALPDGPFRVGYGCDLAYKDTNRADWSVLLQGRWYFEQQALYITKMWRHQWQAPRFNALMRTQVLLEPGPVIFMGAPAEEGTASLVREHLPSFRFVAAQALGNKYARAVPVAEQLWNAPNFRCLVPSGKRPDGTIEAPRWLEPFLKEVAAFTGEGDAHDDIVDALAALAHNFIKGARMGDDRERLLAMARRYGATIRGRGED